MLGIAPEQRSTIQKLVGRRINIINRVQQGIDATHFGRGPDNNSQSLWLYPHDFAERTFRQLEGFGSYGFHERHAASFALIAYAFAWLKYWRPDGFCAALLNSQPMGVYAPAQIVRDAQDHGIEMRPVCVNASDWDCTLDPVDSRFAVRLGLRMVKGLGEAHAAQIARAAPFTLGRGSLAPRQCALGCPDLHRRGGRVPRLRPVTAQGSLARQGPVQRRPALFAALEGNETALPLRPMSAGREVVEDYSRASLSLRRHPVAFLRGDLARRRILGCAEAMALPNRRWAEIARLLPVRQRPCSAKGTMFITLEDETGITNLVVWPKVFEANRRTLTSGKLRPLRLCNSTA